MVGADGIGLAVQRELALEPMLADGANTLGVSLQPCQRARLLDYLALLERWNRAFNLTAISTQQEMVVRHLLDAMTVLPHVKGPRLLDVGSGAGVPGLVIATALPECQVTVLDCARKRVRFLSQAVHELKLTNVDVAHARLEQFRAEVGFDTVISRATMSVAALTEGAQALLRPQGQVLAMLGLAGDAHHMGVGGQWRLRVVGLQVPGLDAARHLAIATIAGCDSH